MQWGLTSYTILLGAASVWLLYRVDRRSTSSSDTEGVLEEELEEQSSVVASQAAAPMIVWQIYYRILKDFELAPYFQKVNTARIVNHQVMMFKAIASNTIPPYSPNHLKDMHHYLNITDDHFSKLLRIVLDVYVAYDIDELTASYVLSVLESYRPYIVRQV